MSSLFTIRRLALIACSIGLAVAGCGGGAEEQAPAGGGGSAAEEPQDAGGPAPEKSVTVDMKNIKFVPMDVTVAEGGTVDWTNSDQVPHTVTKGDGPGEQFDSGTVGPGGTYKRTFRRAGKVNYVCTIHPGQTGTVTVR